MTLDQIEQELSQVRKQVDFLEREISVMKSLPVQNNKENTAVHRKSLISGQNMGTGNQQPVSPSDIRNRTHKDMERFVGRSVMGVLAALLIFISMEVFVAMVLPSLSVSARMVILYIASIIVTAVGFFMIRKKIGWPAMVAAAIGCGGIYVSLILSRVVFVTDNSGWDIMLYLVLLLWCTAMFFIWRWFGGLFEVISHVGITVAFWFGVLSLSGYPYRADDAMAPLLVLFLIAAEGTGVAFSHIKGRRFQPGAVSMMLASVIFYVVSCIDTSMFWMYDSKMDVAPGLYAKGAVLLMTVAACILTVWHTAKRPKNKAVSIAQEICSGIGLMVCGGMADNMGIGVFFSLLCMVSAWVILFGNGYEKQEFSLVTVIFAVLGFLRFELVFFDVFAGLLVILPVFMLSVIKSRKDVVGACMALYVLYAGNCVFNHPNGDFAMPVVMILGAAALVWAVRREEKNRILAGAAYLAVSFSFTFLVFVLSDFGIDIAVRHMYGIIDVISIRSAALRLSASVAMVLSALAAGKVFINVWDRKNNTAVYVCCGLWRVAAMTVAVSVLYETRTYSWMHIIAVIAAIACFSNGFFRWLEKPWGGAYVGIKFMVLFRCILETFETEAYLQSICFFGLSMTAVLVGFMLKNRSLRMFGLILACVSVCKLLLSDLSYGTTGWRAASFLICGLLCFGISTVYGVIEKKQKSE